MSENPLAEAIRSTGVPGLLETTKEFVEKLFGPAVEEGGELLRDYVRSYRWRNQVNILSQARAFAAAGKYRIESVPLRTLVPLLEGAGLEDDPALQNMWAALLANAGGRSESGAARPAFVEIMKQLSPPDAWVLSNWFVRYGLPVPTTTRPYLSLRDNADAPFPRGQLATSVTNFERLGILSTDLGLSSDIQRIGKVISDLSKRQTFDDYRRSIDWDVRDLAAGRRGSPQYNLSPLGFQFLVAVLPPLERPIPDPWGPSTPDRTLAEWAHHARSLVSDFEWDEDIASELQASVDRTWAEFKARREQRKDTKGST